MRKLMHSLKMQAGVWHSAALRLFLPPLAVSFRSSVFQPAFSLVEVTVALGIAGFCLLTIVGLLPVGLSNNMSSIEQPGAANLARGIITDLRAAQNSVNTNQSPQYGILFSTAAAQSFCFSEDGRTNTVAASRYLATITIDTNKAPVPVIIKITWPASALAALASDAFEVTTAIDR